MAPAKPASQADPARPLPDPLSPLRPAAIGVPRGAALRNVRGALSVLALGLILTVLASLYLKAKVEAAAQREFEFACNEIRLNVADRLAAWARVLHSGAALFGVVDNVSREEWRGFTQNLRMEDDLPGIQGIGYAQLIPREQLAQHLQATRREGFPDYQVRPVGERETYSAIIYLEPFSDRNLRAFGYDMLTESVRRAAMERARDENVAALSGKVILVQETGQEVQAGTLMYVPVYRHGAPIETIEQRRAAIQGWVYSPYRMNDLMRGTLRDWNMTQENRRICLQVYDGDEVSARTLLYDSQSIADHAPASMARITRLTPVDAAGHRWTVRFNQFGDLASSAGYGSVWLVLFGGTMVTLLFSGLAIGTDWDITARKRAKEALRDAEATVLKELDTIIESAEPEGDIDTLTLADVIDPEALQAMMDDFYRITHIGIGICDVHGNNLVATGWQDICTKFHRVHPETLRNCRESDCSLAGGVAKGACKAYRCKNNLWDVVTPIVLGGRHLGNVFFGQYFYEDEILDYELFRSQARRYGFDETEYLAALDRVHRCSREKVDAIMAYYARFAEMISSLSYSRIQLSRSLSRKDEAFRQLRASEDLFRKAFLASPDAIAITRLADGMFVSVNQGFEQIAGYTQEQAVGKTSLEINLWKNPEDRRKVVEELRAKREVRNYGATFLTRKGEVHGLMSATIIELDSGPHILHITRDITDRKLAEDALARLGAQLQAKNVELEQLVYVASHDLRSPLVNIGGWGLEAEYAIDELNRALAAGHASSEALQAAVLPPVQEISAALRYIRGSTTQMDALLAGLLKLSRYGRTALTIVPLNMNELIAEVVAAMEFQVKAADVELQVGELPPCRGDATQVSQVFTNLLGNSIKYRDPDRPCVVRIGGVIDGPRSVYFVEDNGIGIAPAHQEIIFEVFHRLEPSKSEGDGLGLTIVRQVIGRLDGEVRVESTPGEGSRFSVALPVADGMEKGKEGRETTP